MKRKRHIYCILLILISAYGTLSGQTITITPKWTAQAQFAGYYVADKMGFYKEEGIDIRIIHTALSESSFSVLQSGKSQAAVMNLSFALTARAAGAPLVNIMQTSQENSLILVSRHPLLRYQIICILQCMLRRKEKRISNNTILRTLYLVYLFCLLFD